MRVFVTGATGFIGSHTVPELLRAGHTVLGMSRSEEGAKALAAAGVKVHRGDIYDLDSIRKGAEQAEAVIHLAFNHDFSKFAENAETDRKVITTMGEVLKGSDRPMLITSGTGVVGLSKPGHVSTEDDRHPGSKVMARAASEEAADALVEQGVRVGVVRALLAELEIVEPQALEHWKATPERTHRPSIERRIRGMGALLRGREGAEGPRRAGDGAARVMLPAGGQAAQPPWGTRLPRPRSHQVHGRSLGRLAVLSLNTTRPGVVLAPGPASHLPWVGPGASESRAPLGLPSRTPRLAACLHTSRRRTRRSRTPPEQLGPIHSRRPLLHRLLPGRCLTPRSRLLCLGELAPNANVTFNNGNWDGGIYAVSLTGTAEGHLNVLNDRAACQ